jgi:7,8-dihydropterin-6-yl-methyl-4-(beta-D-ribofuranosyl)aminobenzene 5'-phosphate synthase
VLYDAFGGSPDLERDWGYSALIEIGGRRILFDTGNNAGIFARNVLAKGIDLAQLDFAVVSHRHGDHIGGLSHLLSVNPEIKVYAPKENFGIFGSSVPNSFYRRDESLAAEMRYYGGKPPKLLRGGVAWPHANFELIEQTTEIAPGIHLIALVSDRPGTLELRELSLAIETPQGMVILVGCSHPGIENIVTAAAAIDPHIHFIAGGMHLVTTPDPEIARIAGRLRDEWKVNLIAPGHCTGEPAFGALQRSFGERYLYAGLGTQLTLAPESEATADVRRLLRQRVAASEWSAYRTFASHAHAHD